MAKNTVETSLNLTTEQVKLCLIALHCLDRSLIAPETREQMIQHVKDACRSCCFVFETETLQHSPQTILDPSLGPLFDDLFYAYYQLREAYYEGSDYKHPQFDLEAELVARSRAA